MISEAKYFKYFDYIFYKNGLKFYKYGTLEKALKCMNFMVKNIFKIYLI